MGFRNWKIAVVLLFGTLIIFSLYIFRRNHLLVEEELTQAKDIAERIAQLQEPMPEKTKLNEDEKLAINKNQESNEDGKVTKPGKDEATAENGCMTYVPGSHRHGIFPVGHDPERPVHHIPLTGDLGLPEAVACPVGAGAVIFHHGCTLHASADNQTDTWRRALIFHFSATSHRDHLLRRRALTSAIIWPQSMASRFRNGLIFKER